MIYNVPSSGYGEVLINAGDGPSMIINRDEVNELYIADSLNVNPSSNDIDIIDPLSFMLYDGTKTKYGLAQAGTIQVNVTDAINWAPSPAQAAQQIALQGIATAANQQTQLSIGGPAFVPGMRSSQLLHQTTPGTLTILDPLALPIKIWGFGLSYAVASGNTYAAGGEQFYAAIQTESGITLPPIELAIVTTNQLENDTIGFQLPGLLLNPGDVLQLNINGGTSVADVIQRASATILYTIVQPVTNSNMGLVGAYIKPSQYGTGTTIATAESNWAAISGFPVATRRVYWFRATGANAIPAAITGPGTGSGDGQLADAASGIKNVIDFTPTYTNLGTGNSLQDYNAINQYLASCKAAGLVCDITLWHEPYSASQNGTAPGLTASVFQAMFKYYGPMIQQYYPVGVNLEAFNVQQNNETSYYPTGVNPATNLPWVDKFYIDFYAKEYFDADNIRLDTFFAFAAAQTPPPAVGVAEFNSDLTLQTTLQTNTFFAYIQSEFTNWLSAAPGNQTADIILFNNNEPGANPYISSSSDIRVALLQSINNALSAAT